MDLPEDLSPLSDVVLKALIGRLDYQEKDISVRHKEIQSQLDRLRVELVTRSLAAENNVETRLVVVPDDLGESGDGADDAGGGGVHEPRKPDPESGTDTAAADPDGEVESEVEATPAPVPRRRLRGRREK